MTLSYRVHREKIEKIIKRLDSSFYLYDLDHLKDRLHYMDSVKDQSLKLWYACKANPLSAILKIFRNLKFGVDVASLGELEQALRAGVLPQDILCTGPAKSPRYLQNLVNNEVEVVVLEGPNQAIWLNEVAKNLGKKQKVLLRVQMAWQGAGQSVLGGNDITAFGVEAKTWIDLNIHSLTHLEVIGLHIFQWGNILQLNELQVIWEKIVTEMLALAKELAIDLKILDLGGGLGIPYQHQSTEIDFKDVNAILVNLKQKYQLDTIWMELGRYAVGTCGHYFSRIVDRKSVRGQELLILEGGMNHFSRPALTGQAFPCTRLRDADDTGKVETFHVHGPLCTALDKLGIFELPTDTNVGDWLVFSQAGAYGFTEAMPFFLCHDLPAEVVLYNGDVITPRTIKKSTDWLV